MGTFWSSPQKFGEVEHAVVSNGSPIKKGKVATGGLVRGVMAGQPDEAVIHWFCFEVMDDDLGLYDPVEKKEITIDNIALHKVGISEAENKGHYNEHANGRNWPLDHEINSFLKYVKYLWSGVSYIQSLQIQMRMAKELSKELAEGATVEVHDYQVSLVPKFLRFLRPDVRVGYFQHSRFPSLKHLQDEWATWPEDARKAYKEEILGKLGADYVGCHSPEYVQNLIDVLKWLGIGENHVVGADNNATLNLDGREIFVDANPIGVDVDGWEKLARNADAADGIIQEIKDGRRTLVEIENDETLSDAIKKLVKEISEIPQLKEKIDALREQNGDEVEIKNLVEELDYRISLSPACIREVNDWADDSVHLVSWERLEYTKGFEIRLKAIKKMLEAGELDPNKVHITMVAASTGRDELSGYDEFIPGVEGRVKEIQDNWCSKGLTFEFRKESHDTRQLAALVRSHKKVIGLFTPYKDGMNMAVQEFVSMCYDNVGVVVMTNTIGAAQVLQKAIQVLPTAEDVAKGIKQAVQISGSPAAKARMVAMRKALRSHTVKDWAQRIVKRVSCSGSKGTRDFKAPAISLGIAGNHDQNSTSSSRAA